MSPILHSFYHDIQKWIYEDCPENSIYEINVGLCHNLDNYAESLNLYIDERTELCQELMDQFSNEGFSRIFPFDRPMDYQSSHNCYTNPLRLQWIKDHQ